MNRTVITAILTISVAFAGYVVIDSETGENIEVPGTPAQEVQIEIQDDGTSQIETLPIVINGAIFLPETRYTYNDLLSEIEIMKRRADENYTKVETLTEGIHEQLLLLPERAFPTMEEMLDENFPTSTPPDFEQ